MYAPATQVMLQNDGTLDPREREVVEAYGAPDNHVLHSEGGNHSSAGARRKGCLFFSSEFAGAGTVTPAALRIASQGLPRALHAFGVLNEVPTGVGPPTPPRYLEIKGDEHYVYANDTGLYEPLVELGDEVRAGDPAAAVHFPETPLERAGDRALQGRRGGRVQAYTGTLRARGLPISSRIPLERLILK